MSLPNVSFWPIWSSWSLLKYPIPKPKRIALVKLYYELVTTPGLPSHILSVAADALNVLTRSKKKLSIEDIRLPWKPVFDLLSKELFLSRRKFELKSVLSWLLLCPSWPSMEFSQIPAYMGYIADCVRRFYHPVAAEAMLEIFLPLFNGTDLDVRTLNGIRIHTYGFNSQLWHPSIICSRFSRKATLSYIWSYSFNYGREWIHICLTKEC